ncbi:hypothetical protein ACNANX_04355 [Campylobacter coli]
MFTFKDVENQLKLIIN